MITILSNWFTGLATIFTGLVAWGVFYWQKRTDKIQAARVLLTEIRIAEERINQIRDKIASGTTMDLPPVFPTKNWKNYSHLFISNFDQDELRAINTFYDYGEYIEEFAQRNNAYFWISTEERGKVTVQKIAEFAVDAMKNTPPGGDPNAYVAQRRDGLNLMLDSNNTVYTPTKTLDGIRTFLQKMPTITTSGAGIKLKNLARMENR